jgi:hypothetical protein
LAVAKREVLEALRLTKPEEVTTEPKKEFVDVVLKEAAHSRRDVLIWTPYTLAIVELRDA